MADDDTSDLPARTTAPQSSFGGREVRLGLLVLVIGLAIAFGIPAIAI